MLHRLISAIVRRAHTARLVRKAVPFGGLQLPPTQLRRCTAECQDDEYFIASAMREADRVRDQCGLRADGRILEIGCGAGRLPLGLLARRVRVRSYVGVDVDKTAIAWCRRWIAAGPTTYRFRHLDIQDDRYNRGGTLHLDGAFRFDFPDEHFDVIYLYSVFTHMTTDDIDVYLREIKRLLAPGGRVFLTACLESELGGPRFVAEDDRPETLGPLHHARIDLQLFEAMLERQGLAVTGLHHGTDDLECGAYIAHREKLPSMRLAA